MRRPKWRKRTRREIRRALTWGAKKLALNNWTFTLFFDKSADDRFTTDTDDCAGAVMDFGAGFFDADIGIWMNPRSKDAQDAPDRLYCLFHELGHLSCSGFNEFRSPALDVFWEQAAERVAFLLYELYQKEGRRHGRG